MNKIKLALIVAITIWPFGCASTNAKNNVVKKSSAVFGVDPLPDTWRKKSFRGADLFFEHENRPATIFLHAECERVSDSPPEALLSQMLVGMGKYEIVLQKRMDLGEREALIAEVNVNLDGVFQFLKVMIVRKNRCVFDAVLNAKQRSDEVIKDFDRMVMSFWAEAPL